MRIGIGIVYLILMSCNQQGPCDYNIQKIKAQVTELRPYTEDNKDYYHIVLKFNTSSLSEKEQYLDELKGISFDSTLINVNRIKIGNIYAGTVSEVISGNCEPLIVSFNHRFRSEP